MSDRGWTWARTCFLALSGVTVAALVWSLSGADEKGRPRRRKGADDEDDDSLPDGRLPKSGREATSQEGADPREKAFPSESQVSAAPLQSTSQQAAALALWQQQASSGTGCQSLSHIGTGSWPKSPASPSWPASPSSLAPRRWQAAMSASEKKELDLMFRHQERHEGRGTHVVVDLTKAKARQRNRQHRREVPSPVLSPTLAPEEDPELMAEELLAEEEALRPTQMPSRAKKAKKKPRKKKSKTDSGQAVLESPCIDPADGEEPGSSGCDMEAPDTHAVLVDLPLIPEFPGPQEVAEVVDSEEDVEVVEDLAVEEVEESMEESDEKIAKCREVCDAAVQTSGTAGTPTTEDPSSTGASSTRQNSEAGDDAGASMLTEDGAAAAVVATDAGLAGTGCSIIAEVPRCQAGELSPLRGRARRLNRAWADLTDTSDGEPSGAWSVEPAAAPAAPDSPGIEAVEASATSVPSGSTGTSETTTTAALASTGACEGGDDDFLEDSRQSNIPWMNEEASKTSCKYDERRHSDVDRLMKDQQHSWVRVQTRNRARKAAKV